MYDNRTYTYTIMIHHTMFWEYDPKHIYRAVTQGLRAGADQVPGTMPRLSIADR